MLRLLLGMLATTNYAKVSVSAQSERLRAPGFEPENPWIGRANSDYIYQFNDGENSWGFARERCLAQGADLLTIKDQAELDFILSVYARPQTLDRFVLIGLTSPQGHWRWIDDNELLNSALLPWAIGEPINGDGFEHCAKLHIQTRELSDISCEHRYYPLRTRYACKAHYLDLLQRSLSPASLFVLALLVADTTPGGTVRLCKANWYFFQEACYRFSPFKNKDWFEGRVYCEEENATYSSVHNQRQMNFFDELHMRTVGAYNGWPEGGYWFGGDDIDVEGHYVWLDGSPFDFTPWTNYWLPVKQPSDCCHVENCIASSPDRGMHDVYCSRKQAALCRRPPKLGYGDETTSGAVTDTIKSARSVCREE